jgi:hypothetical protein
MVQCQARIIHDRRKSLGVIPLVLGEVRRREWSKLMR